MKMYRQGDVLIMKVRNQKVGARVDADKERTVLAYGEMTGHAHALPAAFAHLFEMPEAPRPELRLLRVVEPTELRHEEHAPIKLSKGLYKIFKQREYVEGELRNVAD